MSKDIAPTKTEITEDTHGQTKSVRESIIEMLEKNRADSTTSGDERQEEEEGGMFPDA